MSYLHSHSIIHRDLKPGNILMDNDLYPKITDFGTSKILHQNEDSLSKAAQSGIKGTLLYTAPEILKDNFYSFEGDVYSFSIVMFEILTNQKPFGKISPFNLMSNVMNGVRPEFKTKIPESFKSLIEKCWSHEPFQRPTFDDILLELRENPKYITELYDENEFLNFIEYIDHYKISFDNSKISISIDDIISPLDEIIEPNMIENNSELNLAKEKNETNMDEKETELNLAEKCTKSQLNINVKEKIDINDQRSKSHEIIDLNSSKACQNSVECIKSLADNGDVNSMFNYAMMLEKGNGIEVDLKAASKYYKMAADNGHLDSMYNYAQMLFNGTGISVDKKEAAKYY